MELLGRSLGDIIEKQGRLPLRSVLRVADQTVRAAFEPHYYDELTEAAAALGSGTYP